jgi:hypothetical protein
MRERALELAKDAEKADQSLSLAYSVSATTSPGTFGSGTTATLISGNKLVFINNTSTTPTLTVVEK